MKKLTLILFILFTGFLHVKADVNAFHNVIKLSDGMYEVTTTINGLKDMIFARVSYAIPNTYIIDVSSSSYLTKQSDSQYKFYITSSSVSGAYQITFKINAKGSEKFDVNIDYAIKEIKSKVALPSIEFSDITTTNDNNTKAPTNEEQQTPTIVEEPVNIKTEVVETSPKTPTNPALVNESKLYSIQLFSVSKYNEAAVIDFCLEHNLKKEDIVVTPRNGAYKISVKRFVTSSDAKAYINTLKSDHGISDCFVIKLDK